MLFTVLPIRAFPLIRPHDVNALQHQVRAVPGTLAPRPVDHEGPPARAFLPVLAEMAVVVGTAHEFSPK